MTVKQKNVYPVLVLFFLSPAIGELLSGSLPPSEFFSPFSLFLMAALYGSGAILIRELRVRWGKGWLPVVLILGAAYGIIEEGLACKSFFDPGWGDLGLLGSYGRWAGVNWVWSLNLTIYHMVFSIATPILLVELLFPTRRDERWVGRRGMIGFSLLLAADVLFCFVAFPYRPPLLHILLTVAVVVALYWVARRLPASKPTSRPGRIPRPLWFACVGFIFALSFYFFMLIPPELDIPVSLTLWTTLVLPMATMWLLYKMSRGGAWNDKHRLALASGVLMFLVLIAPLQELDTDRLDNTTGMTLVGLITFCFLVWLRRRVRRAFGLRVDDGMGVAASYLVSSG
ncbi:MAG: hypothetical protein GY832_13580 [Chloroflexi bacterium]|nr:hypothetical protein [Chloroflexota bacterium]